MATLISALETQIRYHLVESTASFWSSDELVAHLNNGIKDLWRGVVDLGQEHFLTVDQTNVSMAASSNTLTGTPADVYKVHIIEPRDLTTSSASRGLTFMPADLNSPDFQAARSLTSVDPVDSVIYYALISAGAPTAAPTIWVAPKLTSAVNLTLIYIPVLAAVTTASNNPIPGESDQALIAWGVAWARAKEREDRSPDPNWLAAYGNLKQNLLTSLTPRQVQEPDVVVGLFEREF